MIKQLTEIKAAINPTNTLVTYSENSADKTTQNSDNVIHKTIQNNNKEPFKKNHRLVLMCNERNISFLSHEESTDPSKHLNESKLHLNSNGIKTFAENFSRFLVKLN